MFLEKYIRLSDAEKKYSKKLKPLLEDEKFCNTDSVEGNQKAKWGSKLALKAKMQPQEEELKYLQSTYVSLSNVLHSCRRQTKVLHSLLTQTLTEVDIFCNSTVRRLFSCSLLVLRGLMLRDRTEMLTWRRTELPAKEDSYWSGNRLSTMNLSFSYSSEIR